MATLIQQPTVIQAAGQPPKSIEEFIGRVNSGKVVHWPYAAEARPHIPQAGCHCGKSGDHVHAQASQGNHPQDKYSHVEQEKSPDAAHDCLGYRYIAEFDHGGGMGMNDPEDFKVAVLEHQDDPHDLDAAAGRSGHASQKHADKEDGLRKGRPFFIIGCYKSCRGENRYDLK